MAELPAVPTDDARWQALLRRHGLRCTRWRCAVLRVLWAADAPISHQELTDALEGSRVDRATVYRNLMALVEAELVRRIDLGDHIWRFELRERHEQHLAPQHPHFLCTECGLVRCLGEAGLSVPTADASPFVAAVTDVVVRGRCQECT